MRLSKLTLRKVALKFVYFQTRLIVFLFPERLWYPILFQICRKQQYLLRLLLMLTPFRNDPKGQIILIWLMESTLLHLFSFGRPFPIPIRQKNIELICSERSNPNGLVLCSLHLPFVMVSLRLLMESGVPPTAVVANSPPLIDGRMPVFSTAEDLPGLIADSDVLFKLRTILRKGGFVAALVDSYLGDPPNRNVFHLIRLVGACVVFVVSELQPDGSILIEFISPPDPFCMSNESVISNLLFLQNRTHQILQQAPRIEVAPLQDRKSASQAQAASLEPGSFS